MSRCYVIVTGPPASGKSTVAPALARELRLPLIAKDVIKDAMIEVLPPADVEESRRLGTAAVAVMFAVARTSQSAVLESVLRRSTAGSQIRTLDAPVVEVFCRAPQDVCKSRYASRAGTRLAGYFDDLRTDEELWNPDNIDPVAGGWPVIEVDTRGRVDIEVLASEVLAAVGRDGGVDPV